jgi:hypothetical protein
MRVLLMFDDRDFNADREDEAGEDDLIQDLELNTLWTAAAAGDDTIRTCIRSAMLSGLTAPEQIGYRLDVLTDCLHQPIVVRDIYRIAVAAIAEEREIYRASFYRHSSGAVLNRSVTALDMFVTYLKHLRALADEHASEFRSSGFVRFFATVHRELDDNYFSEIAGELRALRFRNGLLASARLGKFSQGIDYVLRTPRPQNRGTLARRRPPIKRPTYGRTIPNGDDAGSQALGAMRDRVLSLAADAVAQSAEHVLAFFAALRTELAFYLGCLNLHDQLTANNASVCQPDPRPLGTAILAAQDLRDPCLTLRATESIHGNDLHAGGNRLIIITGANQGGKSTFLRSIGVAQLMMQAGMFVAAKTFTAAITRGVYTHFKREEDATMVRGKFDEELHRMSEIGRRIRPHSMLLCNESFAATNEREAAEIAFEIIRAMNHAGISVGYVTHLYELSHRLYRRHRDGTLFLRAERDPDGHRPYRIIEAEPLSTSYGEDVYRQVFGENPTDSGEG